MACCGEGADCRRQLSTPLSGAGDHQPFSPPPKVTRMSANPNSALPTAPPPTSRTAAAQAPPQAARPSRRRARGRGRLQGRAGAAQPRRGRAERPSVSAAPATGGHGDQGRRRRDRRQAGHRGPAARRAQRPGLARPGHRPREVAATSSSITAYEAALALLPDHADVANDLGRLAFRMGQKPLAGPVVRQLPQAKPDCPHGANNLACALRDLHEFPAAIELLQKAITAQSGRSAMLWNTLGTVVSAQGDAANALHLLRRGAAARPGLRQGPLQPRQHPARVRRHRRRPGRLRGGDGRRRPGRPSWR